MFFGNAASILYKGMKGLIKFDKIYDFEFLVNLADNFNATFVCCRIGFILKDSLESTKIVYNRKVMNRIISMKS